jgi:hypothetical protein
VTNLDRATAQQAGPDAFKALTDSRATTDMPEKRGLCGMG